MNHHVRAARIILLSRAALPASLRDAPRRDAGRRLDYFRDVGILFHHPVERHVSQGYLTDYLVPSNTVFVQKRARNPLLKSAIRVRVETGEELRIVTKEEVILKQIITENRALRLLEIIRGV